MHRARQRNGYVLVMALVMIVLAGFLLTGIARHSLASALVAVESQEALQRRWGAISCERAFLNPAEDVLHALGTMENGGGSGQSVIAAPIRLTLGGLSFDLLLADESAKSNLNAIHLKRGDEEVARVCKSKAYSGDRLPIVLRPAGQRARHAFQSWGQVFDFANVENEGESIAALMEATGDITCWGNGRLNVHAASDEQVRTICRLAISDNSARQLLTIRRQRPDDKLQQWLGAVHLSQQDQSALAELLSEESTCFSLWLTIVTPERPWREFIIAESLPQGNRRVSRFVW